MEDTDFTRNVFLGQNWEQEEKISVTGVGQCIYIVLGLCVKPQQLDDI